MLIPRALTLLAVCIATAHAATPTGLLNDTGQTQCDQGDNTMGACTTATTGDTAIYKRQDGRFGRDVAGVTKIGGGAAGFDFTKVCMNGTLNCTTAANTGAVPAATDWACTKDNVTNLIWSLQTQSATWNDATVATYPDAGHNTANRCGYGTGWRLPTRRELLSIVHNGVSSSPAIDVNYFPATVGDWYWTSDTYAPYPSDACFVNFDDGYPDADYKTYSGYVRLVRSGQ
ncbi:MAG: hypothetical protein RIR79_235 [Pseudomonadota bacterium]|jgi:hypothetical protein